MDAPFVRIPVECLSQVFRKHQKTVTKELTAVADDVDALTAGSTDEGQGQPPAAQTPQTSQEMLARLEAIEERLRALREVSTTANATTITNTSSSERRRRWWW